MAAGVFHLTNTDNYPNRYAIEQGATFNWFSLVLDGDFSTWTPKGQIRNDYAASGGVVKAAFTFAPLQYGQVKLPTGETVTGTTIQPILTKDITQALDWAESKMKSRASTKELAIAGKNVWVYDIEIESPQGEVMRVVQGYVEINLEATR